jgi:stress response protein YsnF
MAISTNSTIVAVYSNVSAAQSAVDELKRNGFSQDEIYVSSSGSGTANARSNAGSSAPEREGGITGWFKRVFGQEEHEDRAYYENAANAGNVVVSVNATGQNLDQAADILNRHSPIDVQREAGTSGPTASRAASGRTAAGTGTGRSNVDESEVIPVVDEELQVGKRSILRGGVRVYARTVEQPVEETLRLQEERVRVDRQRVDRPVTQADLRAESEQVIEVKEYAEEPVVSKQARVVEEVRVGKDRTEREQTIRDTVRHTEVGVENLGSTSDTGLDDDFRRDFESRYGASGGDYNTYGPAYNYGYQMASDPRYRGINFDDVESDLRSDYGQRYPNSTWEKMKDSIRYGWNKVTGKTSTAAGSR